MKDDLFIRGNVPMTKSEVRAVICSKLELVPDAIVYDIGAGTGSVSVEAAIQIPQGHLYAVEQKAEAVDLINQNIKQWDLKHVTVIEGVAPDVLQELPAPTHVFIGGSSGKITSIIETVKKKNCHAKVVISVIALETLTQTITYLNSQEISADIIQMQISRSQKLGKDQLMRGENPVYIISL